MPQAGLYRPLAAFTFPVLLGLPLDDRATPPDAPTVSLDAYREPVARIYEEALRHPGAYEALVELCRRAPKRLAGSLGAADAVKWGRETLESAGADVTRLEEVRVPCWVRGSPARLVVTDADPRSGRGVRQSEACAILALGGSVPTPKDGLSAPVLEVKTFAELDALGESAKGKVVFFNRPMDPSMLDTFEAYGGSVDQRVHGAREAAKAGAIAVVVRSMTTALDDFPHTGMVGYAEGIPPIPACAVSTKGAAILSAMIAEHKGVHVALTIDCRTEEDRISHNVVGELTGASHPDEIVVVGAHLDAWDVGHGAHDDGAGCVQAIEVIRILKTLGLRPKRTIRAVLFMNEENGLRGAKSYYQQHLATMPKHVLAIESDRGGFTPRGFTTKAGPASRAILEPIGRVLEPYGAGALVAGGGGADIAPMEASGVPTLGYLPDCQRYFDLHHSEQDTIDKVHPRELQLGAATMAAMAYIIADLETRLPPNPVETESSE